MPLCTVSFHGVWFVNLTELLNNATSLKQLREHEYVLSAAK